MLAFKQLLQMLQVVLLWLPAGHGNQGHFSQSAGMQGLSDLLASRRRNPCVSISVHRDDLLISVNGMDVRHFGSQGQQRTATLAHKMAEYQLVTKLKNEAPVLLLDDVFSDLDETRRTRLLQMNLEGSQCILTCTEVESLPTELLSKSKVYHVQAGTLR